MKDVVIPTLPLVGGCQCGTVRYQIVRPPLTFYVCHCTECQKQSASAFGESLQIEWEALELSGEITSFERPTESGRRMTCRFCPRCGTRLAHHFTGAQTVNVRAGTLDDPGWLRPAGHIWTRSKQPWVNLPEDGLIFEAQPDVARLRDRWREMVVRAR